MNQAKSEKAMTKIYEKTCKFCGEPFTTSRANKENCSPTHAKYESLAREGKKERPVRVKVEPAHKELAEEEKLAVRAEIESLNPLIDKLDVEIQNLIHAEEEWMGWTQEENRDPNDQTLFFEGPEASKIPKLFLRKFRLLEKRNDLIKSTLNSKTLVGAEILNFHKSKTIYPFSQYLGFDFFLGNLEDLPQPFRGLIYGPSGSGKTLLSVKIANHLLETLETNVMIIVDEEQLDSAVKYIDLVGLQDDKFILKIATSIKEVEEALSDSSTEFLFIDSLTTFSFSKQTLFELKKRFPKVSIFCTSEKRNPSFGNTFNCVFKVENSENRSNRQAYAKTYNNGKESKDNIRIFYDDKINNIFNFKFFQ